MRLQRMARIAGRRRNRVDDRLEQRREICVGGWHADAGHGAALAGDRGDDREVEQLDRRVEVEEQLLDLGEHLVGPGVVAVDLVQHEHRRQARGNRLRQHVAGLRQRPLGRVDEQQDAVDHGERPLDLAAEVGVTRRVDEVDAHVVPLDGAALARIVMPRSRSWSFESMTRSTRSWLARNTPVARAWHRRAWSCRGRRARRARWCGGARSLLRGDVGKRSQATD